MVIDKLTYEMKRFLRNAAAACKRCCHLLLRASQHSLGHVIQLVLTYGVYPSLQLCTSGYRYVRTRLLRSPREVEVNAHPETCAQRSFLSLIECMDCDTPLMGAVRWGSIAMTRLLVEHGANPAEFVRGPPSLAPYDSHSGVCTRKTALSVAVHCGNKEIVTELVTSAGVDVNQSLGAYGTVLHVAPDDLVPHLLQLGADPHATGGRRDNALCHSLRIYQSDLDLWYFTFDYDTDPQSELRKISALLSATGNLDTILSDNIRDFCFKPFDKECVTLFLQHGARIQHRSLGCRKFFRRFVEDDERFIELLLAADTDFSDDRQRIASFSKDKLKSRGLTVLARKLSQPLTLQAWCVISVRLQLRRVKDCGLWASIEKLPLPTIIKDRLRLKTW